jgi:PEP-CTERM motif
MAQSDGQDLVPSESDGLMLADSFSTGGVALILTKVTVKLTLVGQPDFTKIRPIVVELYTDNGKPGLGTVVQPQIGRITEMDVKDDGPNITLTPNFGDLKLAANTRYWVVLTDITPAENGKQTISWYWSTDITGPGVANEYYIDTTGQYANNDTLFGPFQMQIVAQTVPEPSTTVLLAAGVFGGGVAYACCRKLRLAVA